MKRLSIVIPFYNENQNISRIYEELAAVRRAHLQNYALEILFMDNHSTDDSLAIAVAIAQRDPEVRVIRLSRNFGYQANILTGFLQATGDAAIQLDADGEDDPTLIPEFVKNWEAGFQVVYGVRRRRVEGWFLTLQRKIFYRVLRRLSSIEIPVDAGDFRLIDRRVLTALGQFSETSLYLRGLIAYTGYKQIGIPYDRRPRFRGESKFNWWTYSALAWDALTAFSRGPLHLSSWLGFTLSLASFGAALFYLAYHFVVGTRLPGFTTLILVQLFLAGVQLLCIGVLGAYIGRLFDEAKARPRSIIEFEYPTRD